MTKYKWIAFFAAVIIFIASLVFLALFMRQDIPGEEPYYTTRETVDFYVDKVENTQGKRSHLDGHINYCGTNIKIAESVYRKDFNLSWGQKIRSNVEIQYYYRNNGLELRVVMLDLPIKER